MLFRSEAGTALRAAMARAAGVESFDDLEPLLREREGRAAEIAERVFAAPS